MSMTNTDKTVDEQYLELFAEYRDLTGGGVRVKDFARWIASNKKLPEPSVDIATIHARKAKNAIRRKRIRDLSGRQIQPVVAIQIEKMTRNGQKVMDVIYDYLHDMSLDYALSHFEQKDKNIGKQRKASTRNLQSCLDFNPNLKGHENKFSQFLFILEEQADTVEETIEETPVASGMPTQDTAAFVSDTPGGIEKERRARDNTRPR